MKRPNRYQSISWVMDLKSTPVSISVAAVQAAEQRVHAAVSPNYLNINNKKATPNGVAFFYEKNIQTVAKITNMWPFLRTALFVSIFL